ncbi:hypothetical protein LNKW23_45340 [Paralimibaculum aggregatum]|uniref:DUF306 domain-containing protein n=1 Tax=Paralimibaculum aggregatum TaxID=3036245 RepID=A0ABQ6LT98_9RHOB|nr:META domain-containing protein [Limibaculum sp. NKW23]GMG85315.1 hypothetical protein LNKW23_45340 [Limibaculum sp. NKW23]
MPRLPLAAALLLLLAPPAAAEEGPDWFRVVDVPEGEVLVLRSGPSPYAAALAEVPPETDGLPGYGCTGGLGGGAWQSATIDPGRPEAEGRWCRVGFAQRIAWAPARHLAEGTPPPGTGAEAPEAERHDGARVARLTDLDGTGWTLTGIEGDSVRLPAWLSFENGRLEGSGGCTRFRAQYTTDRTHIRITPPLTTGRRNCIGAKRELQKRVKQALVRATEFVASAELLTLYDSNRGLLMTLERRQSE